MSTREVRKILAEKIKEYREKAEFDPKEAGLALGKSDKTIYAWEKGRGQPDADMLVALRELYKVKSVSLFFGEQDKKVEFSFEEKNVVELFRSLNTQGQALAVEMLQTLAKNPVTQK